MDNAVSNKQVLSVLKDVRATLDYLHNYGCVGFDSNPRLDYIIQQWEQPGGPAGESLNDIQNDLGDCHRCKLSTKRTRIVFGEGNPQARLVFVDEGPGFEEDRQGRPFVGAAGNLLNRIIEAMHLRRRDVYICNVVKCRPPRNRNPHPDEIATCTPFLARQLRSIEPDYICALGKVAAQTLLNNDDPVSRLRGRFHSYQGIPVMPTYHPADLLRDPEKKRDVWHDIQQLMKGLGL